ncbi:MAG: hypothetical protein HRT69_11480 [Flavobacteriaceae bacterium]|nr:hypothetical protein [Flavobacteriaceae bacterium]
MEVFGLILLLLAYSLGIVAILIQVICYKQKIEYYESILLSVSFLLLIITATVSQAVILITGHSITPYFLLVVIAVSIFLGISVSLNIIIEREVKISRFAKPFLYSISIVLLLFGVSSFFFDFKDLFGILSSIIICYLIAYAMIFVRKTKSMAPIKQRKKNSIIIFLVVLPLLILFDFFIQKTGVFSVSDSNIPVTLPVIFIILSGIKIYNDVKRLEVFRLNDHKKQPDFSAYNLTNREIEVTELIIKGASYKQIGDKLFISLPTVKSHISNIYRKTSVNNKVALINLIGR